MDRIYVYEYSNRLQGHLNLMKKQEKSKNVRDGNKIVTFFTQRIFSSIPSVLKIVHEMMWAGNIFIHPRRRINFS